MKHNGVAFMSKNVAISINGVYKKYNESVIALNNVSFDVYHGEIFSILGPNGAGKTTLFKILIGELKPTKGDVQILGVPQQNFLNSKVRFKISYVPQENIFWENLTVEENLELIGAMYKLERSELRRKINILLEEFDLEEARKRFASKLSGGMKRKLTIAMSLINDPDVIILDEPTVGLDPETRASLIASLEKLKAAGKTILLTTHIVETAERISDRVAIMNKGHIIAIDTVDNLIDKYCGNEVIEVLFQELTSTELESIRKLANNETLVTVGDKVIVTQQHTSIVDKLLELKSKRDDILAVVLRKSTLEDAFLFATGELLEGRNNVV